MIEILLHLTDQQFLDSFIVESERSCIVGTHAIDGYTCSNFRLENSKILNINGKKAFQVQYSVTMNYSDGPNDDFTWLVTQIIDNTQSWRIMSSAFSDEFLQYSEMLDSSHRSFQLESSVDESSISVSKYHSYSNPTFGYKIEYPSTWSKIETGNSIIHVVITSPFESGEDEFCRKCSSWS